MRRSGVDGWVDLGRCMPEDVMASETLIAQKINGERFVVNITIGRPSRRDSDTPVEWSCPIEVYPLHRKMVIRGSGSFAALCFALRMIQSLLTIYREQGGKLFYEDGSQFSLETYLPTGFLG